MQSHGAAGATGVQARAVHAAQRTRAGLLAGAGRAFAEHGPRRATMQGVAAAAGVSKATLYNHFRTKDEVAAVLLGAELTRLAAVAEQLPTDAALGALADELGGHPVLRRLAVEEPDTLAGLLTTSLWPELVERLATALGVDVDSAELAARWLLGVVLQPGRSTTRRRHAARLAALLGPA